ncbi:MAG: hypothetical protein ACEQSA_04370 [Weeksellaceae bacterium]
MENSSTTQIVKTAVIMIGVIVAISLLLSPTDKFLRVKAVEICSTTSRFEETIPPVVSAEDPTVTTGNVKRVSYPVQDIFQKCLKAAGY